MGFNLWFIFASILLVAVRAHRYDQGPQLFYNVASNSETYNHNENGDVILYLTPHQVRALVADGIVTQSSDSDSENNDSDSEVSAEPQVTEEEIAKQDENEDTQEVEESQEEEQENSEDTQNQDIGFAEILRILNEEVEQEAEQEQDEEEKQAPNEPKGEEDNTESPRNSSPRLTLRQLQLRQKQQQEKRYSYARYQPNEQRQRNNGKFYQQQQEEYNENEERKKFKLIPYEVEETSAEENSEEQAQNGEERVDTQRSNDLITLLNAERWTGISGQRRNRLQSALRELRTSSKYNKQKYAFPHARTNWEKQNTASNVETNARVAPVLINQQLNKKLRLNKAKQGEESARNAESQKSRLSKGQKISSKVRTIAVPVMKAARPAQKTIAVPVETSKRINLKNAYVRSRNDKPYIISRRVPENKRQDRVNPRE